MTAAPGPELQVSPDLALLALARPLTRAGGHTYAAVWPFVNRPVTHRPHPGRAAHVSRELVLVRDDGQLLFDLQSQTGQPHAPLDCYLPRHPPLPDDRLWSGAGLKRYLDGRRPDSADVFQRLVAVLAHFVDFTDSLGSPAVMAEFFAAYLLTTWFGPAFPISPLLWLTGDHGAGKSRLLALLASMAHLGLYLPVPPPPAALRALAGLGASLAVDDADVLADQPRPSAWSSTSRRAILLAGRQRGALLPITLPENSGSSGLRRTHQLDISGPRLFAAAGQPHPAVARYFIVVPLVRTAQARLSAVDPADPASWPSDISPTDLIDDLWSLSLSRLHELAPHLPLAAAAAAQPDQRQPESSIFYPPLQGAALQPWHSVLAVASWLNAAGVSGLFARLLALSQAYQADRPAPENADLSVLVLKALLECASQRLTELNSARFRSNDVDDDPDVHDIHDADDAQTLNSEQSVSALERNLEATQRQIEETLAHGDIVPLTALPAVLSVSAALVLDAMRLARVGQRWDVPLETLTTRRVGQILSNLGLSPHRMATTRSWNITPAALARLARAYGLPLPDFLSAHFASFIDPSSPAPPP